MTPTPPAIEPDDPAPTGNGLAVASVACGLMVVVPFVTSALAIAFSYLAFRRARRPGVGGRRAATLGMVLGFLGLAGWGVTAPSVVAYLRDLLQSRSVAERFLRHLAAGDLAAASTLADPTFDRASLGVERDVLAPHGRLESLRFTAAGRDADGPEPSWTLSGEATFAEGARLFRITTVRVRGAMRVRSINLIAQ